MSTQYTGVTSINGIVNNLEDAKVPLSDRGFLFGHSIFETLLIKSGKITNWDFHFKRLLFSCTQALIQIPNETELLEKSLNLIEENKKRSGIISEKTQLRIIVTGGNSFDLPIQKINNKLKMYIIKLLAK